MDSVDVSMASWNYFHPTINYPDAPNTNGFKKFSLGAIKVISYFTIVVPLIMLAVHHRATKMAFGDEKHVYKFPVFEQNPKIVELAKKHLSPDPPSSVNTNELEFPPESPDVPKEVPTSITQSPVAPQFVTVSTPNKPLNPDEKDELEFIDAILGDKDLHQTVEMIVTNVPEINKSIKLIVDGYDEYRKIKQLPQLDVNQQMHLLKFMGHQIQGFHKPTVEPTIIDSKHVEVPFRTQQLPNGYGLKIYNTNGNGSCGIHALVGEPKKNQYQADGAKVRKTFCDELRQLREKRKVPERIVQVLLDYLQSPDTAPSAFSHNKDVQVAIGQITVSRQALDTLRKERAVYLKELVQTQKSAIQERIFAKIAELQTRGISENEIKQDSELVAIEKELKDYQLKKPENKEIEELERKLEDLIRDFIYDEKVFEAYLGCLQKVGQYLLQDELAAIADSLGKRIVLFQPGWGDSRNQLEYAEITSAGMKPIDLKDVNSENMVCIFYNGFNHYERAEVAK